MNWIRKSSKNEFTTQINFDLWKEIQLQFKPYNPDGKSSDQTETIRHQMSHSGEVRLEFDQAQEAARKRFLEEKEIEEKEHRELISQITDADFLKDLE